ncbi:MAG TPA: glutamine--tRNA ligase, partial [Anaeromyxobacteraceae bacterium]|nr:glutamine--tRNA ligase [Anaeromyxobacteraceae bacterium]
PALAGRYDRLRALGLAEDDADLVAADAATARYHEAALAAGASARGAARWLLNDLAGLAAGRELAALPLTGDAFGRFVKLVEAGRLAPAAAKVLLADLAERGGDPERRMSELGLSKVEDRGAVEKAVERAIAAHAGEAQRYRAGEKKLLGFLLGVAMKEAQGSADPQLVRRILTERLGG